MAHINAPRPSIKQGAGAPAKRVGRPQAASRGFLEEAAAELFLEQGFAATTIADIARRAGVARSTFFNYFTSKADVLWSGFDTAVANLSQLLQGPGRPAGSDFDAMLIEWAATVPPENVVMVYTQAEPMGLTEEDIRSAAGSRFMQLVEVLTAAMQTNTGPAPKTPDGTQAGTPETQVVTAGTLVASSEFQVSGGSGREFAVRLSAGSYAGVLMVAVEQWAISGGHRGEFASYVREALAHLQFESHI